MKKALFILIYLIFHNLGHSQLTIGKIWVSDSNKHVTINAFADTLDINEINTIKILSAIAKTDNGDIIKSKDAYPDMYYRNSDNHVHIQFKSESKPIHKIDTLKVRVKYFTPTEENKSLISINSPLEKTNLNLLKDEHPGLKFIILDFPTLKRLKKDNKKSYEALIKDIEEKNETSKGNLALLLEDVWKSYEKFSDSDSQEGLFIYMEDPKGVIQNISTYNNNNEHVDKSTSNFFSDSYTSFIQVKGYFENPQNNWTLKVCIVNDKSTREIELKVINLAIPGDSYPLKTKK